MNITQIKNLTNNIVPIEPEAWNDFEQYFSIRTLKKNEVLWNINEVCKHIIFINKGLLRYYHVNDDREIIGQFIFENQYYTDYYSFISQNPCTVVHCAIEDTEIITIPRPAIYELYNKYKSFERLGRQIAEQNFIAVMKTQITLKSLSPEEKYLNLIAERPKVVERVPLNMIASYLNMTPEHLSRIRKKLARA